MKMNISALRYLPLSALLLFGCIYEKNIEPDENIVNNPAVSCGDREKQMDWLMILVQLVLAGAAIWYTFETRRLRQENQEQLKLLKEQTRLSLAPFLVPGLIDVDLALAKQKVLDSKEIPEPKKREMLANIASASIKFMCAIDNPSSKIGHHVNLWVYDSRTRSFLSGDFGKEWIAEKGRELIQVSAPYFNTAEVSQQIREQYGSDVDFIFPLLTTEDVSYLVLLFRDIEGRLYAVKRGFQVEGQSNFGHYSSSMHFAI